VRERSATATSLVLHSISTTSVYSGAIAPEDEARKEVHVLNKILMGLGVTAVLGLMVAGVAYAVTGSSTDGRAGEGSGGRWQDGSVGGGRPGEGHQASESVAVSQEWLSVSGVVQSIDGSLMIVQAELGDVIEVTLGQSGYWEAQGLSLAAGDAVVVEGFYEDEDTLSARSLTLVSTGQTVVLRDDNGRPMWAGGRRGESAGTAPAL
jgi:hypothetical protein